MALKPTIYKVQVQLADSDREVYDNLSLTIAMHPSETTERMLARLLAFCLNSDASLEFTRGLSSADEPAIWQHSDSGEILHWIELGQPEEPRLRKASGRARQVSVYAFGRSAATWWKLNGDALRALPHTRIWQFDWEEIQACTALLARTMQLSVSIVGGVIYIDSGELATAVTPTLLWET
jgi:uncharacterized protein YaeQ